MQFIEDKEFEIRSRGIREHPLCGTEHHVLQHHVVGEQDVRRIILNPLLRFLPFLPGITIKADWNSGIVLGVSPQCFKLAVDERVHRINDDGSNLVLLWLRAEHVIHNGNQVS